MATIFEQQGGTYSMVGDYHIPNLSVPRGEYPIGKYGRVRLDYLKQHRPVRYINLLTSDTLYEHLWDIEQRAIDQVERLVDAFAKANGTDEALKVRDQLRWVG